MNAYRVHVSYMTKDGDAYSEGIHVTATTREKAIYEAFDTAADHGLTVLGFREVYVLVDDKWHESHDHSNDETSKV